MRFTSIGPPKMLLLARRPLFGTCLSLECWRTSRTISAHFRRHRSSLADRRSISGSRVFWTFDFERVSLHVFGPVSIFC